MPHRDFTNIFVNFTKKKTMPPIVGQSSRHGRNSGDVPEPWYYEAEPLNINLNLVSDCVRMQMVSSIGVHQLKLPGAFLIGGPPGWWPGGEGGVPR